jgi:hypothetical protein
MGAAARLPGPSGEGVRVNHYQDHLGIAPSNLSSG